MKLKAIVLCDNGEYSRVADLCKKFRLGVDIDAFYDPEFYDKHPEEIGIQLDQYRET
jgi:hypothetical protein